MAKVTWLGWSKEGDEIPQPIGIIMGAPIRANREAAKKKAETERKPAPPKEEKK